MPINPNIPLSGSPGINLPGIAQAAQNFQTGEKEKRLLDLTLQQAEAPPSEDEQFRERVQDTLRFGFQVESMVPRGTPPDDPRVQQALGLAEERLKRLQAEGKPTHETQAAINALQSGDIEGFHEGMGQFKDLVRQGPYADILPKQAEAQKPIAVAEGTALFDPARQQEIFRNEKTAPKDIREDRNGVLRYIGGEHHGDAVFPNVVEVPEDKKENLQTEEGLRKEFNDLTKDFRKVADSYARVEASVTEPSAAGDLALIFNYMKMLDPGSTVREGEFANAQNSASVPQRLRAQYNSVVNGERLAVEQRNDFAKRAKGLFNAAQDSAEKTATAYEKIATSAGVNVGNVIAAFETQRRDVGGSQQGTVDESQLATLPDGTRVEDENGRTGTVVGGRFVPDAGR